MKLRSYQFVRIRIQVIRQRRFQMFTHIQNLNSTIGMVVSSGLGPLPFGALYEHTENYNLAILSFLILPVLFFIEHFVKFRFVRSLEEL